jgi:hypothetical protein
MFNYQFKSYKTTTSLYVPKPLLSQITKGAADITFGQGDRSVIGNFITTEVGNYIVPTAVADLGPVIPKNTRLKDLLGSNVTGSSRLVDVVWSVSRTNYPVTFIDHIGLVDYFVVTSSGTSTAPLVTILSSSGTTAKLKKDMYCVYNNTNQFVRITEILSPTSFRTSALLNLTNSYVYVYANAGIVDKSLDVFCVGVFGQTVAAQGAAAFAEVGATTLTLTSVAGVGAGMAVQFVNAIPPLTTVVSITGNTITLSNPLFGRINQDETVVFAPIGTDTNKEICVLPLDISPPFVGTQTGLDTIDKGIRSSQPSLNVKFESIEMNTSVLPVDLIENYDSRIDLFNSSFSIIAKKVV